MNKKLLMLTTTLFVTVMMVTPLIGTAQALGKPNVGETFTLIPHEDDPTIVGENPIISPSEKLIGPDDTYRLAWGAYRSYIYVGKLGEGVMYVETITSLAIREGAITNGRGTYKVELEITTDGGYGTGTLMGLGQIKWKNQFPPLVPKVEQWWTMSLHGKGDLNGLNVFVEAYATKEKVGDPPVGPPVFMQWWTTTTIMS